MHYTLEVTFALSLYTIFAYKAATNPEKYHCFSRFPGVYKEVDAKAKVNYSLNNLLSSHECFSHCGFVDNIT